jgi:hypothetical protein
MEKLNMAQTFFLEYNISRSDGLATLGTEERLMGPLSPGQNIRERAPFQNGQLRDFSMVDYGSLALLWSISHTLITSKMTARTKTAFSNLES